MSAEPECPECGSRNVEMVALADKETAQENEPIAEIRCECGHSVLRFLKPSQAAIDRGRELAEEYGW